MREAGYLMLLSVKRKKQATDKKQQQGKRLDFASSNGSATLCNQSLLKKTAPRPATPVARPEKRQHVKPVTDSRNQQHFFFEEVGDDQITSSSTDPETE
jgi:hypothetical protein